MPAVGLLSFSSNLRVIQSCAVVEVFQPSFFQRILPACCVAFPVWLLRLLRLQSVSSQYPDVDSVLRIVFLSIPPLKAVSPRFIYRVI